MRNTQSKSRRSKQFRLVENIILVVFLMTTAYLIDDQIYTADVLVDVFRGVALIGTYAMAQSIVLASGGIDLSIVQNGLLSVSMVFFLTGQRDLNLLLAIIAAVILSGFIGFINGLFISKLHIRPIIVTMATALFASGMAKAVSEDVKMFDEVEGAGFMKATLYTLPVSLLVALVVMMVGWAVFRYTVAGRQVFAVGGSERSAELSGLNVDRIKIFSYTIAGCMAGVGGLMVLANSTVADRFYSAGPEVTIFLAVVIGGISLKDGERLFINAMVGACVLAILNRVIFGIHAYAYTRSIIIGILVLIVIALRSNIFKKKKPSKS